MVDGHDATVPAVPQRTSKRFRPQPFRDERHVVVFMPGNNAVRFWALSYDRAEWVHN